MSDTTVLANARPAEVRLSPDGTRLYASDADGFVRVYDVASGTLLAAWDVGQSLGGMDISPDGSFLVVVETQPGPTSGSGWDATTSIYAYKVDTATGAVATYTFEATGYDGTFFDAAVLSDGTALLSQNFGGSGWTNLRRLDFATGLFTASLEGNPEGISVRQSSALSRSPDGRTVLIGEPNISNGQLDMFETGVGIVHTATADGFNWGIQAYNGTYVAQYIYSQGLFLYDARLQLQNPMQSLAYGKVSDVGFSEDGRWLYVLDNEANQVVRINIRLWEIDGTIAIDADVGSWTGGFSPGGRLAIGPGDEFFGIVTDGALAVVSNPFNSWLTEGADTHVGDADSETIYALGGNDIVDAGVGTDTVFGEAGDDQLTGSGGYDRLIGGAGADVLNGGADSDQLFSHVLDADYPGWIKDGVSYDVLAEHDVLNGGAGDDYLFAGYGDTVDGGGQSTYEDWLFISFLGAPTGVSADFRLLRAVGSITIGSTTVTDVEGIGFLEGSNFADFLVPIDGAYMSGADVFGRGGNDHIIASDHGSFTAIGELHGDDGDDIIDGRPSPTAPLIFGDAGNDTLYSGLSNLGVVYGGDGDDTIYSSALTYGGAGNDLIVVTTPDPFTFIAAVYGGEGNDTIRGRQGVDFVDGGAGADTMSYADASHGVTVDLRKTIAQETGWGSDTLVDLENLIGSSFADTLIGTSAVNRLEGGSGADFLDGGAGNDTMTGGLGDDTYYVDSLGDVVNELAGQGTDTLALGFSYTLANGSALEWLTTIDATATTAINLTGNSSVNSLTGNAGANILNGGGGADTMAGLGGDDRYYIDTPGDTVIEASGQGNDLLLTSISYVLSNTVFVESLSTSNWAATTAIAITGNDQANTLVGNAGANILDGGAGADVLQGREGDDRYYLDNAGDAVLEASGEGNDLLLTSVSFVLGASVFVESLSTRDWAATTAINITGNGQANTIVGNAGANTLNGAGGADVMQGLGGNDVYVVDLAGDQVVESPGGGTDEIRTGLASYSLATVAQVENLTGLSNAGQTLTGNTAVNTLTGGIGNDVLDGGTGADILVGGFGDDRYYLDDAGDQILEGAGGGNDILLTGVDYVLAPTAEVESLTTRNQAGTEAIDIIANDLANAVVGNAGANILRGAGGNDVIQGLGGNDLLYGGLGADRLFGGAGVDQFVFNTALNAATNVDKLEDYAVADDSIVVDRHVFGAILTNGWLDASAFRAGAAAADADDRVVYNAATGQIFYDADGNGAAAQVLFATLAPGTALTSAEFFVIG